MKLRVRLGTTTKVILIGDDVATHVQLSELRLLIQNAFGSLNEPFKIGLNKTEPFENEDLTIGECEIVNCDLLYVVTKNPIPVADAKRIKVQDQIGANSKQEKVKSDCPEGPSSSQILQNMSSVNAYMEKIEFCHEGVYSNVPKLLEMLYNAAAPQTVSERVIVALQQLLVECGFQFAKNVMIDESSGSEKVASNLKEVFDNQRSRSFYQLFYIHPDYEGLTAVLICIPLHNDMLVVKGKLMNSPFPQENTPEFIIDIDKYICRYNQGSAGKVYNNLKRLSAHFKNCVAFRLIVEMRTALGLPNDIGFLGLLPELQLKILSYLNVPNLINVGLVCHSLLEKSRDSSLWRKHFLLHQPSDFDGNLSEDWFENYKKLRAFIKWTSAKKQRRVNTLFGNTFR